MHSSTKPPTQFQIFTCDGDFIDGLVLSERKIVGRNVVAESDGSQRDEAVVEGVAEGPVLLKSLEDGRRDNEDDEEQQQEEDAQSEEIDAEAR